MYLLDEITKEPVGKTEMTHGEFSLEIRQTEKLFFSHEYVGWVPDIGA